MPTYVIGDIHGCFDEFEHLLDEIDFDSGRDRIWHVGDLVNGGPKSVETLRWFVDHDEVVTAVLGNHDLHLLAVALRVRRMRPKDNFGDVLAAHDAPRLIDWLRCRPLLVRRDREVMVHAGLLPEWTVDEAEKRAKEIEELLGSSKPEGLLEVMYGNRPRCCDDAATVEQRWRVTINVMTRMRVLDRRGRLDFRYKGTYGDIPDDRMAWFDVDEPAWASHRVLCGHWSALGLHRTRRVVALDTGCRWGGQLTAFRLDDQTVFQVEADR